MKPRMWHITGGTSHGTVDVDKILDYINGKTRKNIRYQKPIINLIMQLAFIGAAAFSLIFLFIKFIKFFTNPTVWFFAAIMICFIC